MMDSSTDKPVIPFAAAGCTLAAVAVALLSLGLLPTGIAGQWQWRWRPEPVDCLPSIIGLTLLGGLLLVGLLYLLDRSAISRLQAALGVALCVAAAGFAMLLLLVIEPALPLHLGATTASISANGYLSFATLHPDGSELLHRYVAPWEGLGGAPGRIATHPPGPALAFLAGLQAFRHSPGLQSWLTGELNAVYGLTPRDLYAVARWYAVPTTTEADLLAGVLLGLVSTLLGCLLPLPAYFVGSALGGRRQGLLASALAATVPSLLVFSPSIDGVAAVLAVTAVAIWLHALQRRSAALGAVAGLTICAAIFWTAGLFAVGVAMAVVALLWSEGGVRANLRDNRGPILAAMGVSVGTFLLLRLTSGYSLLTNLQYINYAQKLAMLAEHRSYLLWLPMNLYDVVLFGGPAGMSLLAAQLAYRRRIDRRNRAFTWALLAAFALVWLSGSTLGEVGRIWLFLIALLVIAPSALLNTLKPKDGWRVLALVSASQLLLALALQCNLALVTPG